jgi:hypothetical protein
MSSTDNTLNSVLWLAAGGAAGYAAARWVLAPWLASRSTAKAAPRVAASSSGAPASAPPASSSTTPLRPRALMAPPPVSMLPIEPYAGPAAEMQPIDPYAGSYNDMRPIDPYADPAPTSNRPPASPTIVLVHEPTKIADAQPTSPLDDPITRPSQVTIVDAPVAPDSQPVTRPSQVDATLGSPPATAFATSSRVRQFDAVFHRYRGHVPIAYMRALVERESNGNPTVRTGSAIGLMQIVPVVLADYNKRHGTKYTSEHLVNPEINVAIGCELLRIIVESYRKNHPRIATMQPDWDNPRFVELLTFGWNAGFSEAGGVGRVARYLEGLGAVDLTMDQVSAHARAAGASKYLSNPAKVAWCQSVVALYLRERALARAA